MAKCKTCGAQIVWGLTDNGKRVPLDPAEKRFVRINTHVPDEELHVRMKDTHVSHFVTCPQADEHRKEK